MEINEAISTADVGYLRASRIRTGHIVQADEGSKSTLVVDYTTRSGQVITFTGWATRPDGDQQYVTAGWAQSANDLMFLVGDLRGMGWTFGQLYGGPAVDELL